MNINLIEKIADSTKKSSQSIIQPENIPHTPMTPPYAYPIPEDKPEKSKRTDDDAVFFQDQ